MMLKVGGERTRIIPFSRKAHTSQYTNSDTNCNSLLLLESFVNQITLNYFFLYDRLTFSRNSARFHRRYNLRTEMHFSKLWQSWEFFQLLKL